MLKYKAQNTKKGEAYEVIDSRRRSKAFKKPRSHRSPSAVSKQVPIRIGLRILSQRLDEFKAAPIVRIQA